MALSAETAVPPKSMFQLKKEINEKVENVVLLTCKMSTTQQTILQSGTRVTDAVAYTSLTTAFQQCMLAFAKYKYASTQSNST